MTDGNDASYLRYPPRCIGVMEFRSLLQDTKMSLAKANELYDKKCAERDKQDEEFIGKMEKYPRCAVLPSPELIIFDSYPGSDTTETLEDHNNVLNWLKEKKAQNVEFFEYPSQPFEKDSFKSMITSAFQFAYDPIRNTKSPNLPELVFWYYAGHGISPELAAGELSVYSAVPQLDDVNSTTPEKLKGGELCLHWAGFCNLNGLVKPFIDAVGTKSNKHLVVVLDSCYSGKFTKDLEPLRDQLRNGCTVTVQASCGSEESAIGGLFTPMFLYLNKDKQRLQDLKKKWCEMDDTAKQPYRDMQVPSPVVETNREINSDDPTIEIKEQNFEVTLFHDSDFFKFCCDFIHQASLLPLVSQVLKERTMTVQLAQTFLEVQNFTVIDFKLITMKGQGAYNGCPLGLFLLEDPNDPSKAVAAHVHFAKDDTSKVGRINLVHHLELDNKFENEDKGDLKRNKHKVPMAAVRRQQNASPKDPNHWFYWNWNDKPEDFDKCIQTEKLSIAEKDKENVKSAMELVKKCHEFVSQYETPNSFCWADATTWNMQDSHTKMFRGAEDDNYWMTEYLRRVQEEYNLPKQFEPSN